MSISYAQLNRQLVAELDRCAQEKDLEKFISHSVDDVVALAPGEPAAVGKEALRTWYTGFYAAFDVAMVHRPIETTSFGEVVVARGNAVGTIRLVAGGEPIQVDNKYLFVLRRQADGSLKIWRAMFNANGPAPAPTSRRCGARSNKEMKLTSVERIGRSQLISSVRQTW